MRGVKILKTITMCLQNVFDPTRQIYKPLYQSIFIFHKGSYQSAYILHREIEATGEQMKFDMKIRWKNVIAATIISLALGALTALAPMFPCGYRDAASNVPAGYGYHSLAKVVFNGFDWGSSTVPTLFPGYSGSGPFAVNAEYWIALLYIPMFMAIILLGWLIIGGKVRFEQFILPSTRSGPPRARTRPVRKSR